jgi:hypothetical protein
MVVVNTKLKRPDDVQTCCGRRDVIQSPDPDLLIGQLQLQIVPGRLSAHSARTRLLLD